jgi:3-hydroxyisobutyrate dehydrogenase-like beta-hydroxyacid dehydrogenase
MDRNETRQQEAGDQMVRVFDAEPRPAGQPRQSANAGPVAFIGAGQMGTPMVRRLLAAQLDVRLYARRPEVRETFAAIGARPASSLAEAVSGAEVVISCLFNEHQVEEVLLGTDGLIRLAQPGTLLVSHTTIGLELLSQVELAAAAQGVSLLDAPVSGAPDDIDAGQLTILAGGEASAVDRALPALQTYGNVLRTGGIGTASRVKLVNNLLYAVNAQTAAAAALLGRQLGVETDALFAAILHCSAASRAMGSMDEFVRRGGKYLSKDVAAALRAAGEAGADAGLLAAIAHDGPLPLTGS